MSSTEQKNYGENIYALPLHSLLDKGVYQSLYSGICLSQKQDGDPENDFTCPV